MSFSVEPKGSPSPVAGAISDAQTSARERAIARLSGNPGASQGNSQATPVQNPNQVSPEELSAVKSGQASTTESESVASAAEVKPEAKTEEPLSSQYAQLAKKERQLRQQAQQVKAQTDALAAREAAIKAKEAEYQGDSYIPKDRLSKDTIRVLEEAGISYEQLTQDMLNAPSPEARQQASVIAKLEAKIAALEEGQNKVTKNFEDSQQNAYKQAVNQLRTEAKQLVYATPDFETIKETNSVEDVVELITKTFEEDGILLTVDEAAKAVEEHLYEEAYKLTQLSKIKKRLASQAVATAPTEVSSKPAESTPGGKSPTMKTLTNKDGSVRKLTSVERAKLAFKGELKA